MNARVEIAVLNRIAPWRLAGALVFLALAAGAHAQPFSSGSDGSYGALNLQGNLTVDLPASGILNCTTLTVPSGFTLRFRKNALNTPVYLLATGDVSIKGTIDVSGKQGSNASGGESGPGGFNGGNPASVSMAPGAGYGPGAGRPGNPGSGSLSGSAGGGSFATANFGNSTNIGSTYGNGLLIPLIGGSGGAGTSGTSGNGGGGGGGAILVASSTKIDFAGTINANGGSGLGGDNSGSGGAIRLVAPVVTTAGQMSVGAGGTSYGLGRIRIDTLNRTGINPSGLGNAQTLSIGSMMVIFPSPLPRLDIIEAAGTAIPIDSGPVFVQLPFGSTPQRTVKLQARDFNDIVPFSLVLTPDNGPALVYTAQIDNKTSNPATALVNIELPVNVQTAVNAWTR